MEQGVRLMARGVCSCILVVDTRGVGWAHFHTALLNKTADMAAIGFRDRVDRIIVGPMNTIVTAAYHAIRPLLPDNLVAKLVITRDPLAEIRKLVDESEMPAHLVADYSGKK
eukprot:NODE_6496_length_564_cov_26.908738_g6081_i0.p1 GENE.NODE_6496_length_564_cov_26.908738_g6081_i0~~NODE_6496_length_564_cov_26.908738_g6081_i0.p1  ORF type:complete len:112 (-),score=19.65 NODE_6496_length_564_cov_26.908738_g6081_i0:146-481(-)